MTFGDKMEGTLRGWATLGSYIWTACEMSMSLAELWVNRADG